MKMTEYKRRRADAFGRWQVQHTDERPPIDFYKGYDVGHADARAEPLAVLRNCVAELRRIRFDWQPQLAGIVQPPCETVIIRAENLLADAATPASRPEQTELTTDDGSVDLADYCSLVEKFGSCREALAWAVERLGGRSIPPDGSTMPWHEFLIAELDGPCNGDLDVNATEPPPQTELTPEIVRNALLLVERVIPLEVIVAWTDSQQREAGEWAARVADSASDNEDVVVPAEPEWTKRYEVDFQGRYVNKRDAGAPPAATGGRA